MNQGFTKRGPLDRMCQNHFGWALTMPIQERLAGLVQVGLLPKLSARLLLYVRGSPSPYSSPSTGCYEGLGDVRGEMTKDSASRAVDRICRLATLSPSASF